ncbi:MAG: hypothetical protein KAI24_20860, partial [Planctomycetes bacterium]|nr:hypothetical protein [Planctomycetota bacterium]
MQHLLAPVAAVAFATSPALAQCPPTAAPGLGLPGTDDLVTCQVRWDPDGAGPAGEVLVVGGSFEHAGTGSHRLLAIVDPATGAWSSLANTELTGAGVRDLAVAPNGDLIVAGTFGVAGLPQAQNVARFDGQSWSAMGQISSFVNAVAVLPNGDVLAGGTFQLAGPANESTIARWDGATWSSFGQCSGVGTLIEALFVTASGEVLVGGTFSAVGGVTANNVARWDGVAW